MKLSRLLHPFCLQAQFDKPYVISITTIQYIRHEQSTHYYVIDYSEKPSKYFKDIGKKYFHSMSH